MLDHIRATPPWTCECKCHDAAITDEHELAQLEAACEDENRALKACCESAASEISESICNSDLHKRQFAAVIYKHMRNGREL